MIPYADVTYKWFSDVFLSLNTRVNIFSFKFIYRRIHQVESKRRGIIFHLRKLNVRAKLLTFARNDEIDQVLNDSGRCMRSTGARLTFFCELGLDCGARLVRYPIQDEV